MIWLKVDVSLQLKIHLFDHMIMHIRLYGCEVWAYNNFEQFEVFHRNYLRRRLKLRKVLPNPITNDELGRQKLVFTVWKRMLTFWKIMLKSWKKLSSVFLELTKHMNKLKWPC